MAEGLFAGAGRHLAAGGRLFLYGPFKRDGAHNAPSNAAFDESLRSRNPEWGVRDTADLRALADKNGLRFVELVEMPSNNAILMFEKIAYHVMAGLPGHPDRWQGRARIGWPGQARP